MKIVVKRNQFLQGCTLGIMDIDGVRMGYTCEDVDRHLEQGGTKIPGKTAIPRGTYPVIMSFSNRFQKALPELLDVALFDKIRIHGGNSAADTEGCILLGGTLIPAGVANCAVPVQRVVALLEAAEERGEKSTVEVM
jgi:hypothetical protein